MAPMHNLTHVLKTDEDCYVRVPRMLDALAAAPSSWMYGGHPFGFSDRVNRDPNVVNYVPYSNWPSDAPLPPYAYGHGAVLTIDLVTHISAGVAHMTMAPNNLLVQEDCATGVWVQAVAHELGRTVAHIKLPFNRTKSCGPADALTHMDRSVFPSLADGQRCIHEGRCCTEA